MFAYLRNFALFSTAIVCTASLVAQGSPTSKLAGTIQDSTGASIPGAQVSLTNVDTGIKRTDTSTSQGVYGFNTLPVGKYKLEVTKEGFKSYSQDGISLEVNSNPSIQVSLEIGAASETIEVTGSAPLVETQSVGVGQVINTQQIVDLPLNGRNPTQLITLSGAAVQLPAGNGLASNLNYPSAAAFSLAGGQANATNYFLDGAYHLDVRTNVGLPLPFPDALDQFKVETSSLAANFGTLPGGAVNAVTRSGTNKFHGTVFEFLRNGAVNAQNHFFSPASGARDSLKRNQFGGTIGGPIFKDKLFFFLGFQATRTRANPFTAGTIVPTAAVLAGDFRAVLSTACRTTAITLPAAYVTAPGSNILKPGLISPVAINVSKLLPTPADQTCGTGTITQPTTSNESTGVARIDFQRNSKDAINFRYFVTDYFLKPQFVNNNILSASGPGLFDRVTAIELGDTYILTSNLVNSARAFYARSAVQRVNPAGIPTAAQLGVNNTYTPTPNFFGQFSVSGYFSAGQFPGYVYSNTLGLADDLTWTKGRHTFIFGALLLRPSLFGNGQFQTNGNATFNGTAVVTPVGGTALAATGSALADFILGNASSFAQGNGQIANDHLLQPSFYAQDNFKLSPKLQINAGVRWDPLIPQTPKYGYVSDFSLDDLKNNVTSKTFVNAPAGTSFIGDAGVKGNRDYGARYGNFAPRFGMVFSPRGDGKEVFRAGYGLFWSGAYLWETLHIPLNPPWGGTISVPNVSISNPYGTTSTYSAGNPFPTATPTTNFAFPKQGVYTFFPNNLHAQSVQQYNFSYERQLGSATSFSVVYLGNRTENQSLGKELNPAVYIPGTSLGAANPASCLFPGTSLSLNTTAPANGATAPAAGAACSTTGNTQSRRTFSLLNSAAAPFYGSNAQKFDTFTANYNGLLASVKYRSRGGVSFLGNYTWSKCLNYGDPGQDITNQFQNPNNESGEYGPCVIDRRGLGNASIVAPSPKFTNKFTNAVLHGWTASLITTFSSGAPFSVTDGTDISLTGLGSDRPDTVGNPIAAQRTVNAYFNTAAFVRQATGTFGNTKRNSLVGPYVWNADMGLWRSFGFFDRLNTEFRVEAFNVFNNTRYASPTGALNSANYGRITSALDPRILQGAIKINF